MWQLLMLVGPVRVLPESVGSMFRAFLVSCHSPVHSNFRTLAVELFMVCLPTLLLETHRWRMLSSSPGFCHLSLSCVALSVGGSGGCEALWGMYHQQV